LILWLADHQWCLRWVQATNRCRGVPIQKAVCEAAHLSSAA
jgi:hypothetical protein